MIGTPFVIVVFSSILAVLACKGLSRLETRYALLSFALHLVAAFAQWALTSFYYAGGDVEAYLEEGKQLARFLDYAFVRSAPEVLKFALHLENNLPFQAMFEGSSGTMSAVAGVFIYVVGPSLLSICLTTSWIGWLGALCLYRVAREEVGEEAKRACLIGILLVPSVLFWSGGFFKEAFALCAFGVLGLATYRVLRGRRLAYLPLVAAESIGVALIKPYILFPFFLAVAAWIYADRVWRGSATFHIRPIYLMFVGAFAVGGITIMGSVFPEYAADNVEKTIARGQVL